MLKALSDVAARIEGIIHNDDFPNFVEPDFLRKAVRDYPERGGKRLRPAIMVWSCGLFGGDIEQTYNAATAVEITHNWTLVHDDIIDQDSFRRGVPSTHYQIAEIMKEKYNLNETESFRNGENFAILCGDIQQAWANHLLLKSSDLGVPENVVLAASKLMQSFGTVGVVSGEALDMTLAIRPIDKITSLEVIKMLELKTGVLLCLPAKIGAMFALKSTDYNRIDIKSISDFALKCGVAFQLRDDYLGIFGDEETLGKEVGGDLREAKPTVLLLTAIEKSDPKQKSELLSYLRRDSYTEKDLKRVQKIMTDCGAVYAIEKQGETLISEAHQILKEFPENVYRKYLKEFADYLVKRKL